ncbi:MAG: hypothetical protein A2W91_05870 [Bacteroidetes bacterium GWF2_38_335]|nr:MAG: hypothetical protein A2W91_05870 [Bacteroidetes bacterium GWF2_38_335]OFY81603.1 MAG: hypothetical protein A2281_11665 [Bacteroidetes bacterium RIFOXYA12_FULL_38_20]HBS88953.1 hypothetical protein [Bacteroidales bacterium]
MKKIIIISEDSGFNFLETEISESIDLLSAQDLVVSSPVHSEIIIIDGYDEITTVKICQKIRGNHLISKILIIYLCKAGIQLDHEKFYNAGVDAIQFRPGNKTELEILFAAIVKLSGNSLKEEHQLNEVSFHKERLSLAQKAGKAGLWDWDIRKNIFYWSPEFLELFGMDAYTVPGFESWKKALHPDDVENASKNIELSIKEKKQLINYYRVVLPDDNFRWIQATGSAYYENNEPVRMIGFCVDITDKKQAEEKLRNSEELYRLLAKNLKGTSVMLFDKDLRFILVEGNMHPDYMAMQQNMIGKTIFEILPAKSAEILAPYYQNTLNGIITEGYISEYKENIYSSSFLPVRDTFNKIIGGMIVSYDVTENKKSEDILKYSEEKFRKAFRSHPGIIGISTIKEGRYVEVNKRFCDILEWSYEEVIGHTSKDLNIYGNYKDRQIITELIKRDGRLDNIEIKLRTKSGEFRSGLVSAETITIDQQECLLLQFFDLTDLKKVEEKLINSKEQYSKIFNHVQDVFYETTLEGKIIEVSPSISVMSSGQYQRDDLLGRSIFEFYAVPQERSNLIAEITKKGFVNDFRIILKNRDGSLLNGSISSKIKKGIDGNPDTIIGSLRDITDYVKTENALIQSEKHYKLITEKNTDVIWLMDLNGKSVFVSPSIERFTGFTEEEYLNQTIIERFTPVSTKKGMEIFSEELRKYKDNPKELKNYIKRLELEYICKDGTTKWGELIVSPYFVDGKLEGIHGVTRDITDRKRKEKELEAALEKAEESDLAKTTFIQNISHEIRTPMNAICGFADMINKSGTSFEKIKEYSKIIKNSSFQLLSVVNDILTVSSLENRKEEYNSGKVNINRIFSDLYAIFSPQTNSKGIEFSLSLPLPSDKSIISTDGTKLTQIIANLISNSVKFTQAGRIDAGYIVQNDSLLFFVKDTGIGIKKQMQEIIFERFKQADPSISANYGGTGLGLSISREFAKIIGGELSVDSEPGKGSSFYLNLHGSFETDKEEKEIITKQVFNKSKILIADDEHVNIILIKEMLSGSEIDFICAANGVEALTFCENDSEISLVLMDIKMPEMNGIEATQKIKKFNPELKIIALTAYGLDIEIEKYKECGFDNYLTKPVNYEVLMTLLKKYLS